MREVVARISPLLRSWGFRGSGQTFRKTEDDFVFVVNLQGSRLGDTFYVNLGVQPTFIPAEGDAELKTIKEYECVLRHRVQGDWPKALSEVDFTRLIGAIEATQLSFFGNAKTLKVAIADSSPDFLLKNFSSGTTAARAALHLARGAFALGHHAKGRELALQGLELASAGASGLRAELNDLLARKANAAHEVG